MNYSPIIGLEIHCELKTKSKMFCSCKNGLGQEKIPNIHICPICSGQPGTLPIPNHTAIEYVIKAGLALNCTIAERSKFDRKNYFYPDLPKGYQISQYDQPLCRMGYLVLKSGKKINITRIHIEEDTGKLNHQTNSTHTLVDLNRAGVPLLELVTEPDIRTAHEAKEFCKELQKILRYLEISDANMEKGQMRCEVNISLISEDLEQIMDNFGTKVEIKNLNSFKSVRKSILYEIDRQKELLKNNKPIRQETRGWDDDHQITYAQRIKEEAADYRYFPEPDIPPMSIAQTSDDQSCPINVYQIKKSITELPLAKKQRFIEEYLMDSNDAEIITSNKATADYTEEMLSELQEWHNTIAGEKGPKEWQQTKAKITKMATGWLVSKMFKLLSETKASINQTKISPENFAELVILMNQSKINSSAGQIVLEEMFKTGADPEHIIQEKNLTQLGDTAEMGKIAQKIIDTFPEQVTQYKSGKPQIIKFLLGQFMKESKGKANPQMAEKLLQEKLS